jgi:hypothetical protein
MEYRTQEVAATQAERIRGVRDSIIYAGLLLLVLVVAAASRTARADELHLIVNGKAIHLDSQPGTRYNESNWGAGFQYDFERSASDWVPFITASGFSDSNENPSYYAGGGWLKRSDFSFAGAPLHADVGVVAFAMWRRDFNGGQAFPGVLPVLSVGGERVALNVTYIPKVDPKMVPILFFQLKLKLSDF